MVYRTPFESGGDSEEDEIPTAAQSSTSPMFTGSLEVYLSRRMRAFTRRLLSLPGGTHFRNFVLTWNHVDDPSLTMALVDGCSHTLESLDITCNPLGMSTLRLRPHPWLTSIPRRVAGADFDRPLESDEAQWCGISAQFADR